jgi:hypothetical protein
MGERKKLFLLDYDAMAPCLAGSPFEAMGFETEYYVLVAFAPDANFLHEMWEKFFSRIEEQQPDVVALFLCPGYRRKHPKVEEPQEWRIVCQRIRENPRLQHTKIVAFLGPYVRSSKQRKEDWDKRYDFYTQGPLRVVEHARIIRGLVGEEVKGFEGVIFCAQKRGDWKIQEHFLNEQVERETLQPDAMGRFSHFRLGKTRLLAHGQDGDYAWGDRIRTATYTYIVIAIKSLEGWQEESLSPIEVERLAYLASQAPPDCQLLIGANDVLLKADPKVVNQVLEQAWQAGGWRVFINEHLWFDGFCRSEEDFDAMVYQMGELGLEEDFIAM